MKVQPKSNQNYLPFFLANIYVIINLFSFHIKELFVSVGSGWKGIYYVSSVTLFNVSILVLLFLRGSIAVISRYEEIKANPRNRFGSQGDLNSPQKLRELLPIFKNLSIWILAFLYAFLFLIRQIFLDWIFLYFRHLDESLWVAFSGFLLFNVGGICSAFVLGIVFDKLRAFQRNLILCLYCAFLFISTSILTGAAYYSDSDFGVNLFIVFFCGFFVLGPCGVILGAFTIELGGKVGCATLVGFFDGIACLISVVSVPLVIFFTSHFHHWDIIWAVVSVFAIFVFFLSCLFAFFDKYEINKIIHEIHLEEPPQQPQ